VTTGTEAPVKASLSRNYWKLWTGSAISNLGDGVSAIAYPWLASAVTRSPVLIALIAVAQRLPWLFFTLPAGVITDRVDRRKLMVTMDVLRGALTVVIAFTVLSAADGLPTPEALASGAALGTHTGVYLVLLVSALLMGMAEVLRDNSAQTFLPAIVKPENLERANGNLWGVEMVMNSFVGPPLGSLLLAVGFALPFFVDAGSFAAAAGLVFLISGSFRARRRTEAQAGDKVNWRAEIKEGFQWLWHHPVLRPMAISLGFLNAFGMMTWSTFILFAQEDLDLGTGLFSGVLKPVASFFGADSVAAFTFSLLLLAGAVGGVVGSILAPRVTRAIGAGPSLYLTLIGQGVTSLVLGMATRWWIAWLVFVAATFTSMLWNIITVAYRQTIIPDALLGRVNSVYRFFGWGMMPIGSIAGGVVVTIFEPIVGRADALRWPFFVAAIASVALLAYAAPRLTSAKLEAAKSEGITAKEQHDAIAESPIAPVPPEE
jgi:MFS family permease